MKRIMTLVLAAAFVFGSLGIANAQSGVDVKVKGWFDFAFGYGDINFQDSRLAGERGERNRDNFIARQRARAQINFIASENLQAVLFFEIGDIDWGTNPGGNTYGRGAGGALAADGVNIETRRAYIDWMVPNTGVSVRMGIQGLALPLATKMGANPVFDDDVAALTVSYKINSTFALTAFWARPFNVNITDPANRSLDDEMDMFGVILPVSLDGIEITPWFVWANVGSATGLHSYMIGNGLTQSNPMTYEGSDSASAWWAGIGTTVNMFDPLTFAFDVMYGDLGQVDLKGMPANRRFRNIDEERWGSRGWFVDAKIDYAFDFGTLGIFGWWSTGDTTSGLNAGRSGRMAAGFSSSGFGPTTFGWDGHYGIGDGSIAGYAGSGTWGVGIQLADFSFIDKLSHTLRFTYYTGTNDKDVISKHATDRQFMTFKAPAVHAGQGGLYLTDGDNAFEINFDHKYKIYENLTAVLELGYIHIDYDDVWNKAFNTGSQSDDAWKAEIHFNYSF